VECFGSARFCREKKADYAIVSSSNLEYVQFYTVCVQVYLGPARYTKLNLFST
jgi:hypothetical protein